MSEKRVAVTGAFGFIGSYLTNTLLSQDYRVLAIDNFSTGSRSFVPDHPNLTILEADITKTGAWMNEIADFGAECVFHLAAIHFIPYCNAHWSECLSVNVIGTQNVFDASTKAKGIVFASSAAVYGIFDDPHPETQSAAPTDVYGLSKKVGEEIAILWSAARQVPVRAARLFNVYGPNETSPHLIPEVMYQAHRGSDLKLGNLEPKRDYIFVGDIVSGLIALSQTFGDGKLFDAYNVGTGLEYSAREVVTILGEITGRNFGLGSVPERTRPSDRMHLCADNAKLRSIGWKPAVEIRGGLDRTWQHFQETGELKAYSAEK